MAFLRRPAVRVTLTTLLVAYLAWGPFELVRTRASLLDAALVLPIGVTALGCALWVLAAREMPARNAWLLLVSVSGGLVMHVIEPFTGVVFVYFAILIAPRRAGIRPALALTALTLLAVPLLSYLTGQHMATAMGLTTGMAYSAVIAFMFWHVSGIRRQAAEVAEARAGEAVLSERARLAREVHDILAHSQSAQIVHLESARVLLKSGADPAAALDRVERAVRLARAGLEETRRALDALRGNDLPLVARLERLAAEFRAATGASCALSIDVEAGVLAAEAKLAVARTAQEALTNVRKHAPGSSVSVALRRVGTWCELEVRNDCGIEAPAGGGGVTAGSSGDGVAIGVVSRGSAAGGGDQFSATLESVPRSTAVEGVHGPAPLSTVSAKDDWSVPTGDGYGLIGMRERAELIGGSLSAGFDGGGFAVLLRVPA
ncbi:sensor histidine kinase [Nonomuraea sp. LPB2021202275-12-8]|uniref:sensor histidine kinase n=1 Tax=Nonomuraea sp. LPB2021202275-12-8 TaxID=3120159 RepID=UPI00300C9464